MPDDRSHTGHITRLFRPVLAAGLCLVAPHLYASPFQHSMTVTAGVEYDSNPVMVADDERSVWRGLLTPDYQLKWKQDENEVLAKARLNLAQSSDTELSDNREDPSVSLKWTGANPRGKLWIEGAYDEAATRETELDDTGELRPDGTRTRWAVDTGWGRAITERAQLGIEVGYEDFSYDVDTFIDYTNAKLSLRYSHLLNEEISPYFQLGASRYEPDETTATEDSSDEYTSFAGSLWRLNELIAADFYAGAAFVDSKIDGNDTNWNGGAALTYKDEKLSGKLGYARKTTSSGAGGYEEADIVGASFSYDYSQVTRLGASTDWRNNRSTLDNDTLRVELWAGHDLAEFWSIRASWQFRQEDGSRQFFQQDDQGKAEANIVMISLRYTVPEES